MTAAPISDDEPTMLYELIDVIRSAVENHPRSLQPEIGPSEVGDRCARRIGYKLLRTAPARRVSARWKPTIGTAVHSWLEGVFTAEGAATGRWYSERRIYPDDDLLPVGGSCDLFDRLTGTVVDFKIIGPYQMKKYRDHGPPHEYRVQVQIYGVGYLAEGMNVKHVAILFLPRDGELEDAELWTEPYDPTVADKALDRVDKIGQLVERHGPAILAKLPTAPAFCQSCPFLLSGSTDPTAGCPGDPSLHKSAAVLSADGNELTL